MITAVIVDDEDHCIDTLSLLIREYCPDVEIVATSRSAKDGIRAVTDHRPAILFLDIEMPVMNGFEMLEQLRDRSLNVIFTTSFNQYALKAIRVSALDYLLKPIDPKELVGALQKVRQRTTGLLPEQFELLFNRLQHKTNSINRLAVPTLNGYELINCDQIVYCEADDNYTQLHMKSNKKLTATLMLKEVEERLQDLPHFVRVHHSYIANMNEAARYERGEGGQLIMHDGTTVNVSRSRKNDLLKWFNKEF